MVNAFRVKAVRFFSGNRVEMAFRFPPGHVPSFREHHRAPTPENCESREREPRSRPPLKYEPGTQLGRGPLFAGSTEKRIKQIVRNGEGRLAEVSIRQPRYGNADGPSFTEGHYFHHAKPRYCIRTESKPGNGHREAGPFCLMKALKEATPSVIFGNGFPPANSPGVTPLIYYGVLRSRAAEADVWPANRAPL